MQDKAWCPGIIRDIQDTLKHHQTSKDHFLTSVLSKSVIPCGNGKPLDKCTINILGPTQLLSWKQN